MAEILSGANGNHGVSVTIKEDDLNQKTQDSASKSSDSSSGCCFLTVPFIQKIIAETLGTFFLIFAGCGAVVVNADKEKVVTLPGISIVWGLVVMVMVYSVGHISGAHFNPAVTIAFATCKRFPWKQVPAYIAAQVVGSTLASGTLRLLFSGPHDHFAGTHPNGTDVQSLVVEFIITFYLMFVISGVATDNRAIGELAGLAVGATVLLNVMFAGPISGASMNPARSLGPAIVSSKYSGIWIYLLGPTAGAIAGGWAYNVVRFTDKPLREITKSASFFMVFAGCGAVVVDADKENVVTLPGISIVWGLVVMVMVYSVGHISGAHFNPAVTIACATRIYLSTIPGINLSKRNPTITVQRTARSLRRNHSHRQRRAVTVGGIHHHTLPHVRHICCRHGQ